MPQVEAPTGAAPPSQRARRRRLVLLAAVLAALLASGWLLPTGLWLRAFHAWVEHHGVWGAVLYALVYVICTVLFVPGSVLTVGAGVLYGALWGTVIVSLAATVGAAVAFLLARYVARHQVRAWVQGKPRFAALDAAIARRGGWVVFLLRLSPVFPFNLLNYALGLTGVPFTTYVLASWLGMLPGTFAYVVVGAAGRQTLSGGQQVWYWVVAAAATLVVTYFITRLATRAIRNATGASPNEAPRKDG